MIHAIYLVLTWLGAWMVVAVLLAMGLGKVIRLRDAHETPDPFDDWEERQW